MSHFSTLATRLTDEAALRAAFEQLGYKVRPKATRVRGWSDQETHADFVVNAGGEYDVGAVRTKHGTFELVADWTMARIDRDKFVGQVSQAYSRILVTQTAKKNGFVVAKEEVDAQGRVHLLLRRFV
ncbi:MAG: DUF1257 domain-containing protein [Planctomycetes bacterium]|nr:DUF1257 domain-containing protein [Planctomycetota bacterium]